MAKDFIQMSLLDLMQPEAAEAPQPGRPGYQHDKDGISPERFERIPVPVPGKTGAELMITVACGDSGNWYFGRDIKYETEGSLYGPWPKFSDKFASKHEAIQAAIEDIRAFFLAKKGKKARKEILAALDAFAKTIAPEPAAALPFPCSACRSAHPGCDKCCNACKDICNAQQYCLVEEAAAENKQAEEAENGRRDSICRMWRDCEHNGICFTPQNEEDCICFLDEPLRIPADLRPVFSRDEQKVLAAGFMLVRYTREQKLIEISAPIAEEGWKEFPPFPTYAAAERKLKEMIATGRINTGLDGKIIMSGWNQPGGLLKTGFEFYRCYGLRDYDQGGGYCIKQGSKNWSNLAKFGTREELKVAWDRLMKEDMKSLEG